MVGSSMLTNSYYTNSVISMKSVNFSDNKDFFFLNNTLSNWNNKIETEIQELKL